MQAAYLKYIISLLIFGTNGIVASNILLPSDEIVFFRTLLGSVFVLAMFLLLRKKFTFFKHKKDFLFLIISGVAMGVTWMFVYEGYQQVGVSITSLLYACGPILVMILAPIIFKERLNWSKIVGFGIVVAGAVCINGIGVATGTGSFGYFCGVMSAIAYAVMIIFNKKATAIPVLENSLFQLIFSFVTVAIFVLVRQSFVMPEGVTNWVAILILGFINTGLGCYLYFSAIGKLKAQTVATVDYLEPLSAVIFSCIILGEQLLPLQIIGAVCIIGGALFVELFKTRKERVASLQK